MSFTQIRALNRRHLIRGLQTSVPPPTSFHWPFVEKGKKYFLTSFFFFHPFRVKCHILLSHLLMPITLCIIFLCIQLSVRCTEVGHKFSLSCISHGDSVKHVAIVIRRPSPSHCRCVPVLGMDCKLLFFSSFIQTRCEACLL